MITLGIPLSGTREWVAGSIYTANLHRVVQRVAGSLPIRSLLLERGFVRSVRNLGGSAGRVLPYSGFDQLPVSPLQRWGKRLACLARHGTMQSLDQIVRRERISLVYPGISFPLPCPQLGWVPDFQHRHLPAMFPGARWQERENSVVHTLAQTPLVAVSSRATLRDGYEFYPQHAGRLRALPFVILPEDDWFTGDPRPVARQIIGDRDYVALPAQLWQHKDHATAFRGFAAFLHGTDPKPLLVCTGQSHDFRQQEHFKNLQRLLAELEIEPYVRFTGLLRRSQQIQVLRHATLLLQPSHFEGWSTLIEDAQMLGKPVLATDLAVHREQAAPDVHYFPIGDSSALAASLRELWPRLPRGWQPGPETAARRRQDARGEDFGRRIFALAGEALAQPTAALPSTH